MTRKDVDGEVSPIFIQRLVESWFDVSPCGLVMRGMAPLA